MARLLKQFLSSQKGQALPIVLGLLAIGGLTITVSLNYATTNLNSGRIVEENMKGVYAAGAGVEHTLWSLKNGISPATQLSQNINQAAVNMQTEEMGTCTLYLGELIEPGQHSDYLSVDREIVWDEVEGAYKYIITVTWQPESGYPAIHLEQVGARLPDGYSYQSGSAEDFAENICDDDNKLTLDLDEHGAYLLNWKPKPMPSVTENETVKTQTFYITGEGSQEGHYAWVVAARSDIGAVGEITGTLYKITATAIRPGDGRTTAEIVADVMIEGGTIHIVSWQITK